MKPKMRMIADLQLFIMWQILMPLLLGAWGFVMWLAVDPSKSGNAAPLWFDLFWGFWLVLCIGAYIAAQPRILCILTLTEQAVTVKIPYSKATVIPYKQYRFVYDGRYFHGNIIGLGMWVHYIIISQVRLSTEELMHVNQFGATKETLKIRYTKKNYTRLCQILPSELRVKMEVALRNANVIA